MILKSHHGALEMLSKAKGDKFKTILNNTPSMMRAIQTLFKHMLKNSMGMVTNHIEVFHPHRNFIRKIANGPIKSIKPVIQKGGSIFQTILSTVLPLLAAII